MVLDLRSKELTGERQMPQGKLKFEQLEALLIIDKNDLDNAVARQPTIFDQVGDEVAILKSRRDKAKEQLDLKVGETTLEMRRKHKDDTVGELKARVDMDPWVKKARDILHNIETELNRWENKLKSFAQRATMLKVMSDLHGQGYWQRTSVGKTPGAVQRFRASQSGGR